MDGLRGGGDFVWKKRRGGLGEIRNEQSLEKRRAELAEIQERRQRQEELRQTRLLAREAEHNQADEDHTLELDFQARAFEFQTLRMKGQATCGEHSFQAALYNLYRGYAQDVYQLEPYVSWQTSLHLIEVLEQTSMTELQNEVKRANVYLENLLQLVELRQKSEKLASYALDKKEIIEDKNLIINRPGTIEQLEREIDFWIKIKTAVIGEMRERLDTEHSLASLTISELRQLVKGMKQNDVWDLGRLISLQLHYALEDERVDVDFWESLESRYAWISALIWLSDLAQKFSKFSSATVDCLEPEVAADSSEAAETDDAVRNASALQLVESEMSNDNMVVPKFSVDIEDPNDVFDRIVLRETAQEAADSQNIIKGGEFEPWLRGMSREGKGGNVKPRYFNRIKVAHEWHKYNQVHYDIDNPPPKSVQGYKFTICYPNLAPQYKPTWKLIEDKNSDDASTVLVKFSAPSYEDVAFRIIRREWDLTPRNGYKNIYEGGILILSFMLKRNRYRK